MVGLSEGNMPTIAPTSSRAASASVAIARALATHSRIVLADEPTANLDRKTGEEILRLMKKINRRYHTTFIFSTHDRRVMNMADRLVRIEDGRITQLGFGRRRLGIRAGSDTWRGSSRGINMVLRVAPCRCIGTCAACATRLRIEIERECGMLVSRTLLLAGFAFGADAGLCLGRSRFPAGLARRRTRSAPHRRFCGRGGRLYLRGSHALVEAEGPRRGKRRRPADVRGQVEAGRPRRRGRCLYRSKTISIHRGAAQPALGSDPAGRPMSMFRRANGIFASVASM